MSITRGKASTNSSSETKVQSGAVATALSGFLASLLGDIFGKLKKMDYEYRKDEEDKKTGRTVWSIKTGGGHVFKMQMTPISYVENGEQDDDFKDSNSAKRDQKFHLHFKGKKKDGIMGDKQYDDVAANKVADTVAHIATEWFGEGYEEGVNKKGEVSDFVTNSHHFKASLKRVTCDDGDEIHLTRVTANYRASEVLADLNNLLEDEEFLAEVGEEPVAFEIIDEGDDGYDVEPVEDVEVNLSSMFDSMLTSAYGLYLNLQCIHWNSTGKDFMELHSQSNDYIWRVLNIIDTLAELRAEKCGNVPNPVLYATNCVPQDVSSGIEKEAGYAAMQSSIQAFVSELELYYCNMDHDVQSTFDEWIRMWKVESDYKMKRIVQPL